MTRQQEYDKKVLRVMIGIYCNAAHQSENLCPECSELYEYACARVYSCPLGEAKTTCAKCPVHCYDNAHRERIRKVMRYSGPRLIFSHPMMAIRHILKEKLGRTR